MTVRQLLRGVLASVMTMVAAQSANAQIGPWTGFYIGANAGYGWASDAGTSDGFIGGLHAGYNWQFGSALLGVEGDYGFAAFDGGSTPKPAGTVTDIDSVWSVRARLGFTPVANILLFGTVGYGGFEARRAVSAGFTDDRNNGLTAGGGLEYMMTPNLIARLESLWYVDNGAGHADTDIGTVRLGMSYKF